jgi:hypothetical protein
MHPRARDLIAAALLAVVLLALVALVFFSTVANADPASLHEATAIRPTVA